VVNTSRHIRNVIRTNNISTRKDNSVIIILQSRFRRRVRRPRATEVFEYSSEKKKENDTIYKISIENDKFVLGKVKNRIDHRQLLRHIISMFTAENHAIGEAINQASLDSNDIFIFNDN